MLYPDIQLKKWLSKYPQLDTRLKCLCGRKSANLKPFITKDYAGVEADNCLCGRSGSSVSTPTSSEKILHWNNIFKGLIG
jgi:hypothetical protein